MRTKIELDTWVRKEHFQFFNRFEEPYFSAVVNVDCTKAYPTAKEQGISFFLYYLHCCITAINQIEAFRYRAIGDEVFIYDDVDVSATIMRPNGTFGFSFIKYHPALTDFIKGAKKEIERVQAETGLPMMAFDENIIHASALPWVNFTALTHARSFTYRDSIPKISFGKVTEQDGVRSMPVSITVHHGLMDGMQVGQFIDLFQQLLNQ
ncbi:chloramphenicol acetyltransferase [Mucilaginibacter glaciei]|uniref:Chloramphenicol acetyltransferase n=1 Tax=Mucilaginibacter glaciei TaxID=2772109 RepID=A0A926S156_9SPHI|nr:chloramphenicol acetyltransferase [Mucilaginibacter glaciei]MBD1391809.1 chloramphenicol acetyltransferase [Mucilaginibacter glaciei]